jgi:hypothetical protein
MSQDLLLDASVAKTTSFRLTRGIVISGLALLSLAKGS